MKDLKAKAGLVIFICFLGIGLSAQSLKDTVSTTQNFPLSLLPSYYNALDTLSFSDPQTSVMQRSPILKHNVSGRPFFCHLEHNFALKSGFPVKFRIGTVQYVDKLENK